MRLTYPVSTMLFALLAVFPVTSRSGIAEIIIDPRPPMRWDEMLGCDLVVTAKYESHDGKSLSLTIVDVLKGNAVKNGDIVTVALQRWYSVETGKIGWERFIDEKGEDGVPKLCYQEQIHNPGDTVPVKIIDDVRNPAVYFIPEAATPALSVRGQVQDAVHADGWKQALNDKEMGLTFRLSQDVNPVLSRDALEELHRTRDPQLLRQMFEGILNPPPIEHLFVEHTLTAIGDNNGDVYNPLLDLLKNGAEGRNQYRFYTIARILARIDPRRAFDDLSRFIEERDPALMRIAAHSIGYVGNEEAMTLAFKLLEDPQLAAEGVSSLRTLLYPEGQGYKLSLPSREAARLKRRAIPRLTSALNSPKVAEPHKRELLGCFGYLVNEPPAVDLAAAEKTLMLGSEKLYSGYRGNPVDNILRHLKDVSDPAAIPLLVKALYAVPEASESQSYSYVETFRHYALICPNALGREIKDRQLCAPVSLNDIVKRCQHQLRDTIAFVTASDELQDIQERFYRRGGKEWIRQRKNRREIVASICREIESKIASAERRPPLAELAMLCELDRARCAEYVEKIGGLKDVLLPSYRTDYFKIAVRAGNAELVDELIAAVRDDLNLRPPDGPRYNADALLKSNHERAYAEYLRILDGMEKSELSSCWNREYPRGEYTGMVERLLPEHAADFVKRTLALLESDSLPLREGGEEILERTLHWNFGFNAHDVAPVRAKKLKEIKPILEILSSMTEWEMRAFVLRTNGVDLTGDPGKMWLPELAEAACGFDPTVVFNSLTLIETITGEYGCYNLCSLTPILRRKALSAFLRDRGYNMPLETGSGVRK